MAHVVLANKLAFQKTQKDNPTLPDGDEEIVVKGGKVPAYVSLFMISALESAGLIVPVGDDKLPEVESVGPLPPIPTAPVMPPDQPPVFFPPTADEDDTDADDFGPQTPAEPAVPAMPKASDNRAVWETYATSRAVGMTTEEADSYPNKGDLITAVNQRLDKK